MLSIIYIDIDNAIATENEVIYLTIGRILLQCIRDCNWFSNFKEIECSKLPKHKTRELFMPRCKRSNDSSSTKSSSASFKSYSSISTGLCDKFNDLLDFDQFKYDSILPAIKRVKTNQREN